MGALEYAPAPSTFSAMDYQPAMCQQQTYAAAPTTFSAPAATYTPAAMDYQYQQPAYQQTYAAPPATYAVETTQALPTNQSMVAYPQTTGPYNFTAQPVEQTYAAAPTGQVVETRTTTGRRRQVRRRKGC